MKNFYSNRWLSTIAIPLLYFIVIPAKAQITLVKDLFPAAAGIQHITPPYIEHNGFLYLSSFGNIIRTDGTPSGTRVIDQVYTGKMVLWDNNIFYINYDDGAIYSTDGTLFNSKFFWKSEQDGITEFLVSAENGFYIVRYEVRPETNGEVTDGYYLYYFSGTLVVDLQTKAVFSSDFESTENTLFFEIQIDQNPGVYSLAKVEDGLVEIINPLQNSVINYSFDRMQILNGDLIHFPTVRNGDYTTPTYTEVWKVGKDGVEKIIDLTAAYGVTDLSVVGNHLYFITYTEDNQEYEMWRTDGSTVGTEKILDGEFNSLELFEADNVLYYIAVNDGSKMLWSYGSDGIHRKHTVSIHSDVYIIENDCYYFTDESGTLELWKTDGSESGTRLMTPADEIDLQGSMLFVGDINEKIIFKGKSAKYGSELFKFSKDYFECSASKVVSFNQGQKNNGDAVAINRSNPFLALNQPQENNRYNFVALGFGGSITLELDEPVYDEGSVEPDMILVETSFGKASTKCYQDGKIIYPEEAYVEVSQDGEQWYSLPHSYCRTSFLDIKPAVDQGMQFAKYVRITDSSDRSRFGQHADGFDVDGLIACRDAVNLAKNRLTNARSSRSDDEIFIFDFYNELPDEESSSLRLYPNPVQNQRVTVTINTQPNEEVTVNIVNSLGQMVYYQKAMAIGDVTTVEIRTDSMPDGAYTLVISSKYQKTQSQLVIMND